MAYAPNRSCNADLWAGMTDGAFKKAASNRGGLVEDYTCDARSQMSGVWHGFHELAQKSLADGRKVSTPYTQTSVAPEDVENV